MNALTFVWEHGGQFFATYAAVNLFAHSIVAITPLKTNTRVMHALDGLDAAMPALIKLGRSIAGIWTGGPRA